MIDTLNLTDKIIEENKLKISTGKQKIIESIKN